MKLLSKFSAWFWTNCGELNSDTSYAHNLAEKAWNHKDEEIEKLQKLKDEEIKKLQKRIDKLEKELKKSNDSIRCNSQYKMKWSK